MVRIPMLRWRYIDAPVGPWEDPKSKNLRKDVETVQRLLKYATLALKDKRVDPGRPDGRIAKNSNSSPTVHAIKRFQGYFMPQVTAPGRVDPLGPTHLELLQVRDAVAAQPRHWMDLAYQQMGVQEYAGRSRAKPNIVMYLSSCRTNRNFTRAHQLSDETSWCAAFVNWVLKKSGLPALNTPWAPSWQGYGRELLFPIYGAIAVITTSGASGRHVGFYVESNRQTVTLLGGNQENRVCEKTFPRSRVVTYRYPPFPGTRLPAVHRRGVLV